MGHCELLRNGSLAMLGIILCSMAVGAMAVGFLSASGTTSFEREPVGPFVAGGLLFGMLSTWWPSSLEAVAIVQVKAAQPSRLMPEPQHHSRTSTELPSGWAKHTTGAGRKYYGNTTTQESTWARVLTPFTLFGVCDTECTFSRLD